MYIRWSQHIIEKYDPASYTSDGFVTCDKLESGTRVFLIRALDSRASSLVEPMSQIDGAAISHGSSALVTENVWPISLGCRDLTCIAFPICLCLCSAWLGVWEETAGYRRRGSWVEIRTLDYENPGSNPGCGVKTLGKVFHSTLLQFTQLNKWVLDCRQWWLCVRAAFAH